MSQESNPPDPAFNDAPAKKTDQDLKLPVSDHGSAIGRFSRMVGLNFLLVLVSLGMAGYLAYREFRPTSSSTQRADQEGKTPADPVRPEVDRLQGEIQAPTKKLDERKATGDPSPQIQSLELKIADMSKTVADMPKRLDSLNQKVDAVR